MLAQRDAALERFDRLRVREVRAEDGDTASTYLARFHSTAASLKLDERIKLVVYTRESMELLKIVLCDAHASKIFILFWEYRGKEDVSSIVPLLIGNCPELASLRVYLKHRPGFDFLSSVLEHPRNKVKVLHMPRRTTGDLPRFFVALGQSRVSALIHYSRYFAEFARGVREYLEKNALVRLKVWGREQVRPEMMMSMAKCTRLTELRLMGCWFSQPTAFTHFPKSITKLELSGCQVFGAFDWSFLANSNLQELEIQDVSGVDGNQLGGALAVHLRAKGLDKLCIGRCQFVNESLAGVEIGRIKRLEIVCDLNDASLRLIGLALQSPNSEMKELILLYTDGMETCLVPALRHPNCSLTKLGLWTSQEHLAVARRVEETFHKRRALFALLQGQQVSRRYCPLRRLPVEMFRLVGVVLI